MQNKSKFLVEFRSLNEIYIHGVLRRIEVLNDVDVMNLVIQCSRVLSL